MNDSKTKPRTLTATLPTGETLSRTTYRKYTHVVAVHTANQRARALAWCGSHALAKKQLRYWANSARLRWRVPGTGEGPHPCDLVIVPVDPEPHAMKGGEQ